MNSKDFLSKYGKLKPIVSRKYVPLLVDYFTINYSLYENFKKMYFVDSFYRTGYINGTFYYGDEYFLLGEAVFFKYEHDNDFFNKIFSNIYKIGDDLLLLSEEIGKNNYRNKSLSELLLIFKDFSKKYLLFSLALASHSLQLLIEKKLKKHLKNKDSADEDLSILSFPKKYNFVSLERLGLLEIALLLGKNSITKLEELPDDLLKKIVSHTKEFGWINSRGGYSNPWSERNIFERALSVMDDAEEKILEFKNNNSFHRKKLRSLCKELKLDNSMMSLVEIAQELVYFRTYRTDYLAKIFFNIKPLLDAIANLRGLSYKELLHLRIKELEDNILVSKSDIKKRTDNFLVLNIKPHELIYSFDSVEIEYLRTKFCDHFSTSSEIIGKTVFKGKVVGRAKIVCHESDLKKVCVGDILVSPMTAPNFIVAMENAAAFVTDEGGFTCHVAIIAREMKKPCIVGTRNATKLLKDDDLIEVDANIGVVNIIERKK
ncbi:MAG: hypothetical protein KKF65_00010 [Nanoarchaeota archaeon]|nr:hypothetical protein [Nanoarchaeota archaeon]